jgi:hypothetical protein
MQVEEGKQTLALYRVGPFATFQEAQNALETISNRSKDWAEEDSEED